MLIVGCGYVGRALMNDLLEQGKPVAALTRCSDTAARWREQGVRAIVGDIMEPASLSGLSLDSDGELLFAVGYDRQSPFPIQEVYRQGLHNVLDHLQQQAAVLSRLVYLSSTGVYGDHQGEWVDEETEVAPQRPGGEACIAAEQLLTEHPLSRGRNVALRLAGIYGPGRIPRLADIRAGKPIPVPPNTWLNLIHLDDIVQVIRAAFDCRKPHYRYCVSDGNPVRRHDYYQTLAEIAGAAAPQFEAADRESPAVQRAASDKRISNRRLLADLKIRLKYPDCQTGLGSLV